MCHRNPNRDRSKLIERERERVREEETHRKWNRDKLVLWERKYDAKTTIMAVCVKQSACLAQNEHTVVLETLLSFVIIPPPRHRSGQFHHLNRIHLPLRQPPPSPPAHVVSFSCPSESGNLTLAIGEVPPQPRSTQVAFGSRLRGIVFANYLRFAEQLVCLSLHGCHSTLPRWPSPSSFSFNHHPPPPPQGTQVRWFCIALLYFIIKISNLHLYSVFSS